MEQPMQRLLSKSSPKPASRRRCEPFLDPVAAWRALPPRAQEEIGATAIALALAASGTATLEATGETDAARPYDIAAAESLEWLDSLVFVGVLREDPALPPVPDLRPLGIQQCTGCGCTDTHACEAGCRWVAQDLCSACAGTG